MGAQQPQMKGFEVDFLDWTIFLFPAFVESTGGLWQWAEGMNRAALKHKVSIQYCMDLPAWAMASLDFAAVTNARGSDDNFPTTECVLTPACSHLPASSSRLPLSLVCVRSLASA